MNSETMNAKEAAQKWHLSKNVVKKICDYRKYPRKGPHNSYIIPANDNPLYIPDKHYSKAQCRLYLYVIDAISQNAEIAYDLINSDENKVRTVVRILRDNDVIEEACGKDNSLNYNDFILSYKVFDWHMKNKKEKFDYVKEIVEAISKGITGALLEHYGNV